MKRACQAIIYNLQTAQTHNDDKHLLYYALKTGVYCRFLKWKPCHKSDPTSSQSTDFKKFSWLVNQLTPVLEGNCGWGFYLWARFSTQNITDKWCSYSQLLNSNVNLMWQYVTFMCPKSTHRDTKDTEVDQIDKKETQDGFMYSKHMLRWRKATTVTSFSLSQLLSAFSYYTQQCEKWNEFTCGAAKKAQKNEDGKKKLFQELKILLSFI